MNINSTYKNNILIACNVINIIYHVPQIIKTYKTKSVKDFDPYYLFLGNLHSFCWVLYSIEDKNGLFIFNSCVTMFSISFVSYYKIRNTIIEYNSTTKNQDTSLAVITVTCEEKATNK
uniref:PQ-loop repeat-containing protein n=1 Tax=viral metagenome TaxID=1070528 RepID=A0A6C0DXE1_9ZZZZ